MEDCIPSFKGKRYTHNKASGLGGIFIGLENEVHSGLKDDSFSPNIQKGSDCTVCSSIELRQRPFTDNQYFRDRGIVKEITRHTQDNEFGCYCSGMHIHLDQTKLSTLTIYKVMVFFQFNDRYISAITRRSPGEYNRSMASASISKKEKARTDKYYRVHTHGSLNTLEFRAFAEALRPKHTYQNIEFCLALVDFCKNTSLKDYWNYETFEKFVEERKHIYKYLNKHMKKCRGNGFRVDIQSRGD
jgi:hypothetical protein